ncbi:MAG: LCP family protein [Elusimicrobia bacterium]|nr:LCP family protein [Candidatus Obscuribacterium magneticum]
MLEKSLAAQRTVALIFLGLILMALYGARKSPVAQALQRGERVPILLFGIDAADASHHTDTILLSVLNPFENNLSLLSIPRDTRVHVHGYLFRRINEIYGYYYRKTKDKTEASQEVVKSVESLLSSEEKPITIPYFIQVDFSGFIKMMDIVGGVWVDIKQPMHYDDNAGDYHFHKEPGRYFLSGREALFYVRFRGLTGDKGRIFRQQEFLKSMIKQLANPLLVLRIPEMVAALASTIHTNLSGWDLAYLTVAGRRLRSPSLGFYLLPGQPRGAYWRLNAEAAKRLAAKTVLGMDIDVDAVPTIVPLEEHVTVKVWNASGRRGLAREVTRHLRQCGYDVVDWENFATEQLPTRVIDRVGQINKAQAVANDLGVDQCHSEVSAKALVDVEVIIGKNFSESSLFEGLPASKGSN